MTYQRPPAPTRAELLAERHADGYAGGLNYPPGPDGLRYECVQCGAPYDSTSGARKHEAQTRHVVTRRDWYDAGYLDVLRAQVRREEARA